MDAKELSEHLVDYLYGELTAEQTAAFERALKGHPAVQRELEALQRTRSVLGTMEQFDPPPALTDRLMAEAATRAPRAPQPALLERIQRGLKLLAINPAVSAAVTVVLVVGLSLYVYRLSKPTEEPPPAGIMAHPPHEDLAGLEPAAPVEVAGAAGARRKVSVEAEARSRAPALTKATASPRDESADRALDAKRRAAATPFPAKRTDEAVASRSRNRASGKARARRAYRSPGPKGDLGAAAAAPRPSAAAPSAPAHVSEGHGMHSTAIGEVDDHERVSSKSKRNEEAQGWLARGRSAVKTKNCEMALVYFDRAVRADAGLAAEVERRLGPCQTQLERSVKAFPVLAKQVHRARSNRLRRSKKAAQDKATTAPAETER